MITQAQIKTNWQDILDDLEGCRFMLSGEAIMLLEGLRGPEVDQVREAIQDLESNRAWRREQGQSDKYGPIVPLNQAIVALKQLKSELEKEDTI